MDTATFDTFYQTSFGRLVGQISAMCGNITEAQDCVQEAFVRAWDKRRSLSHDASPEAWVRTVAYRLGVSRWRRTKQVAKLADRSCTGPTPTSPTSSTSRWLARWPSCRRISAGRSCCTTCATSPWPTWPGRSAPRWEPSRPDSAVDATPSPCC